MITANQQAMIKALAIFTDDITSQFSGTAEEVGAAFIAELQAAELARNGVKASPQKIVDDAFTAAYAISAEVGNQSITTLIGDLQKTEQDILAGRIFPAIVDIVKDIKDGRAVHG